MSSSEDLRIGHGILDAHHEAMLARISELRQSVEAKDAGGAVAALAALWDETVIHFATEDSLMEEHLYPERSAHRRAHHLFVEDLKALIREAKEHGVSSEVAEWALERLPGWVKFHIQANDAPLAQFVVRKTAARIIAAVGGAQPQKPGRSDAS